jgi:Protein of unknown function (DUF3501)
MRKLTVDDIVDLRAYERERDEFRTHVIGLKKQRRVTLGALATIVFENTDTMRFQIQEMARAEKMLRDEQIEHEVETYNELIPEPGDLSATLFLEITDPDALREWLPKLPGIQRHVAFDVAGAEVRGVEPDEERLTREDEITTTVHYLKFTLTAEQQAAFAAGSVKLFVDHPAYQAEAVLTDEQRASLAADFED